MTSELIVQEEVVEGVVTVKIAGEVDVYSAQGLKDKLYHIVDHYQTDLKINCEQLSYIDSTGLGVFVAVLKRTKLCEKDIYLLSLKENIKKLFVITGLDKLFVLE